MRREPLTFSAPALPKPVPGPRIGGSRFGPLHFTAQTGESFTGPHSRGPLADGSDRALACDASCALRAAAASANRPHLSRASRLGMFPI